MLPNHQRWRFDSIAKQRWLRAVDSPKELLRSIELGDGWNDAALCTDSAFNCGNGEMMCRMRSLMLNQTPISVSVLCGCDPL